MRALTASKATKKINTMNKGAIYCRKKAIDFVRTSAKVNVSHPNRRFLQTGLYRYAQTILGLIFRHPVVGVTIIPILADGRIVLVKRRDTHQWGLPGGIVEWGEKVTHTVHRELQEETGLTVVTVRRLVGVYSAPDRDPRLHSICLAIAVNVQGKVQVCDPLEIEEVKTFAMDDLPSEPLSHDHQQQLQDYQQGLTLIR